MTAGSRAFLTKCKIITPKLRKAYVKNLFYKIYISKWRLLFLLLLKVRFIEMIVSEHGVMVYCL